MKTMTRRQMLAAAGTGTAALMLGGPRPLAVAAEEKPAGFSLPPLPYEFKALEPHIDAMTMEIHHDRHHKAYVDNLNKALDGHPELLKLPIDQLLRQLDKVPEAARKAVRNNGGGHYNHTLFWEVMTPKKTAPAGDLATALDAAFGNLDGFKKKLTETALGQFGSGWAWLIVSGGKLSIVGSPNQDNTLMPISEAKGTPILGIDVWEHAYYLKYQNLRAKYVEAWFNVINWENVAARLKAAGTA